MDRKRCGKLIPLAIAYISLCLLFLFSAVPSWAAPPSQSTSQQDDGQEYIVQAGDSLYKISGQFYGRPEAYNLIVEATNAKAATDNRFSPISDPRRIQAGQRLWIPNNPEQPITDADQAEPTATPLAVTTPTTTATTTTTTATTTTASVPTAITATVNTTATGPGVRFVTPIDGGTVPPTFTVAMTATDLTIEPAGEIHEGAGHFHILIDTDFVPAGEVIINDAQHRHYGKGQYTTTLHLDPGEHVLRLQFADGAHIAQEGPAYQDTITVTVSATDTVAHDHGMTTGPSVRFVTPIDGGTVPPTFTVAMTATDLTIEPAGEIHEGAGHFHILIDTDFVPAGEVIINDAQHRHYGKGQYTTTLHLDPGEHVLRLQFADGAHIAQEGPAYQDTITVTVAATDTVAHDHGMTTGPSVRFVTPIDGGTVPPTFTVAMTATDLTIEPAGEIHEGAGHFHILVDTDFVPAGEVIINDAQHRHYGKGQYTTTLHLDPGEHVLRLQFADGAHIAQEGPAYQDTITVTVSATATTAGAAASTTTKPVTSPEPSVRFVTPADGATVPTQFTVEMAASGVTVEPAGTIRPNAGHFHILVDTPFVEAGEVIINDAQHLHYGKGQITTTLELKPGQHVLRLQFANGAHIALAGDAYRDEMTVTVK